MPPQRAGNIVSKGGNSGYRFRSRATTSSVSYDRGATNVLQTATIVPLRQWIHIAVTGSPAGLKIS